ncbi:MAG TPA: DUF4232 domain-containing protein [Solirubrobacteraceae bacterium]|jgi:hypothetical protein|nr:DUF4232 domain-containing protein [Solirubrobacteraceae bacterium]
MRIRAALILACTLAIAACGSSSQSSSSVASTQAASSPATAPATSPTNSTTTSTSTTQTSPATTPTPTSSPTATKPCTAADLALSFLGGQGATGHGELGFELRNISNATCHTYGYPGVLFLDRAGKALPTDSTRTTQDFFGSVPENKLDVAPGQSVSFRLGVTHGAASPVGCTTAYGLQVIPPDDTATLHVAIVNGGAYECRTATVSPLQPGTSAFR